MKFLLITFVRKPNGQIDEMVTVSKRVKPVDIQTCNIILNFKDKKVEKCVIEGKRVDSDWDRLVTYYREIYPNLVEQLEKESGVEA